MLLGIWGSVCSHASVFVKSRAALLTLPAASLYEPPLTTLSWPDSGPLGLAYNS